jgi:hypothetical protein
VFFFDNEVYSGTRISEPSATAGRTDLAAVARDCGIEPATTVRDLDAYKNEVAKALEQTVVRFVVCKVEPTTRAPTDFPIHRRYGRAQIPFRALSGAQRRQEDSSRPWLIGFFKPVSKAPIVGTAIVRCNVIEHCGIMPMPVCGLQ